eukprot:gb/GEZN01003568.1/.p1 GENE.gb/GEZN01003568.1/~~gb/GEZN01003568.1/.p1  ORF type:complete len:654 (-),score=89.08 gb/GEZN01003568.1/:183-1907(-)
MSQLQYPQMEGVQCSWDEPVTLRRFFRLIWRCGSLLILFTPLSLVVLTSLFFPRSRRVAGWRDRLVLWSLETAGPTFIKLGQWMSTRPDLFHPNVCSLLYKLTLTAPSHRWRHTLSVLERELQGVPLTEAFSYIDTNSLHSGAIAQVYRAELSTTGQQVAIKVLHPGVVRAVNDDLWLMNRVAGWVDVVPGLQWLALPYFAQEFSRGMVRQLDLRLEGQLLQQYQINFQHKPGIVFPSAISLQSIIASRTDGKEDGNKNGRHAEAETGRPTRAAERESKRPPEVLLMTWEDGCSVTAFLQSQDREKSQQPPANPISPNPPSAAMPLWFEDRADASRPSMGEFCSLCRPRVSRQLARLGLDAFLQMMLQDNLLHCDLHSGNLLLRFQAKPPLPSTSSSPSLPVSSSQSSSKHRHRCPDVAQLQLVILDVGLSCQLSAFDFDNLHEVVQAITESDGYAVARSMSTNARISQCPDELAFQQDMHKIVTKVRSQKLGEADLGAVFVDLLNCVREHRIMIEGNFSSVVVGVLVVEGLARRLDPSLNVLHEARPYLAKYRFLLPQFKRRAQRFLGDQQKG